MSMFLKFSGLSPRAAASSGNGKSHLVDAGKANGGFVSVQYAGNPSASEPDGGYTGPVLAQRYSILLLLYLIKKSKWYYIA